MPKVALSMKADTLFCRMGAMRMGMDKGGFAITAEKVRDSVWDPKGIIGFNRLRVKTPNLHCRSFSERLRSQWATVRSS